jgi:hypothetical protein
MAEGTLRRVLLAGLLVGLVIGSSPSVPLRAGDNPDTSGEWGFYLLARNQPSFTCIASLVQREADLTVPMSCDRLGFVELTGTYQEVDGTFEVAGDASGAELSLSGTTRDPDPSSVDASGAWSLIFTRPNIHIEGELHGLHELAHRGLVRCQDLGTGYPSRPRLEATAVDAALILQWTAHLPFGMPCLYLGDTNLDGEVNSIDALLILEYTAGVIEHFPAPIRALRPLEAAGFNPRTTRCGDAPAKERCPRAKRIRFIRSPSVDAAARTPRPA